MRILLVEDNADHRELMRLALTEYNAAWQVDGVESGDEALRHLAEREAYDAVFLDYSLPGRDGLEALEEIRRGEAPPPVVMVTGRGDEQVAVKAMKGGAYDYVVKGEGYLQRLPVVAQRAVEANQLAVERKRAEKALRESEERLRTVVEASLDAIIAVNVEGRLVLFNGAAQELFQYSEEEALNQPADILLREEIGEIHQERLEKFLKRGVGRCGHIGRRMERLFRRKDGSLFEAEVSMSGGRLNGLRLVVLAIHDITSRKKTEETLRESEEQLRLHADNSPMAIVEWNNDFIVTRWTGAAEKMFGWSAEETIGKPIMELRMICEEDIPIVQSVMQRLTDGKSKHVVSSNRNYTKKGEVIHCEWYNSVLHDSAGKMISVMSQVLDVTERKQAEEALRRSEENFRRSLDDSPLGVRIVTKEGETIYANRAMLNIYGYDSIEELNTTPIKK